MGNGRWGGWLGGVGVAVAAFGLLPGSGFAFGSAAASLLPQIEIVVDNATDDVNGDVSTVTALLANPGPDGISLREAIEATNADPGSYKVIFAQSLAGSTIAAGGGGFELLGGNVQVEGDIDGDAAPDITLAASGPDVSLRVSSSGNTIRYLDFSGVTVSFSTEVPGASFDGNSVIGNTFQNVTQAVVSHPAGPLVLTEWNNSWTNTLIKDNYIEATQGGIDLMFHFSVGNSFGGLDIIDNQIHMPEADFGGFGIHLSAGFWHGSTDNTFSDVVIGGNAITGRMENPIFVATGAVGADGNLIDDIQIIENTIVTEPLRLPDYPGANSSIMVVASDSGTDYFDPSYLPVQYPNDNAISNLQISGNTIDGFSAAGIFVSADGLGGSHNSITGVEIHGNAVTSFLPDWDQTFAGIHVLGGTGWPDGPGSSQTVSDVTIQDNSVAISPNPLVPNPPVTIRSGGILITGGDHWSSGQTVRNVTIERNHVSSLVPAITIIGGSHHSVVDIVAGVDVLCNEIGQAPSHVQTLFPEVKGINLVGGTGEGSVGNSVSNIRIGRNDVAGVWNDVSASPDMNSATENSIDWLIDDSLAPECPLRRDWFIDDDSSVFEADIEWLAAEGITRGCNPPDNTLYCPNKPVTRGQMAAFLHRALDGIVEPSGDPIDFTDDDDSAFVADIAWLSATGITKGCTATEYCPNKAVTRGQMAAFLVRAMGYSDDGGGDLFTDDDDSVFRFDIDKLATAGVTLGCNPPVNDQYCPGKAVTRGQMAAFLHRSLG